MQQMQTQTLEKNKWWKKTKTSSYMYNIFYCL